MGCPKLIYHAEKSLLTLVSGSHSKGQNLTGVYMFGFQGQEGDDELYGDGGAYSFKYRVHDTRLGRFLSIDPLEKDYPWNSPYAFSENKVTNSIELEGLESVDLTGQNYNEIYKQAESRGEDGTQAIKDQTNREGQASLLTANFLAIATTMVLAPTVGIPWAVSEILGIPAVIPSPQAYATAGARPVVAAAEEVATAQAAASAPARAAATTSGATATATGGSTQAAMEAGIYNTIRPASSGGRLGNTATRTQMLDISQTLESRGYTVTRGGGMYPEEYLPPVGGGRKGGSYLDITATHPDYGTLRINTVDTYKSGATTSRELNNAARIRTQIPEGEHLLLIPKR